MEKLAFSALFWLFKCDHGKRIVDIFVDILVIQVFPRNSMFLSSDNIYFLN